MVKLMIEDLLDKNIPPISYLMKNLIQKKGLMYCFGASGSGKTTFIMNIVLCAASGKEFMNYELETFKTLWIDEENREEGTKDKIVKLMKGMGLSKKDVKGKIKIVISERYNILSPRWLKDVTDELETFKPKLVVIDSFSKVFKLDQNTYDVAKIYDVLSPLIDKFGVSFLFIHHSKKLHFTQKMIRMDDMNGNKELAAQSDCVFAIQEMGDKHLVVHFKGRHSKKDKLLNFVMEDINGGLRLVKNTEHAENVSKGLEECRGDIILFCKNSALESLQRPMITIEMKRLGHKDIVVEKMLKVMKGVEFEDVYGKYKLKNEMRK